MKPFYETPCTDKGLTSYRYKGNFGWIMIGATDNKDALNEVKRSLDSHSTVDIQKLEVWDGEKYIPIPKSE